MSNDESNASHQADIQMEVIRAMVAALGADYSLLEDLRNELREVYEEDDNPEKEDFKGWLERRSADDFAAYQDEAAELIELEAAAGDCESREDAERGIQEDALSVEVRSGWCEPGDDLIFAYMTSFRIVLCTGGPHVQIRGELNEGEPSRAWLEYCDWGTRMTERVNQPGDQDALLAYARCFYFGEF